MVIIELHAAATVDTELRRVSRKFVLRNFICFSNVSDFIL